MMWKSLLDGFTQSTSSLYSAPGVAPKQQVHELATHEHKSTSIQALDAASKKGPRQEVRDDLTGGDVDRPRSEDAGSRRLVNPSSRAFTCDGGSNAPTRTC
jgi:hypothetical protein